MCRDIFTIQTRVERGVDKEPETFDVGDGFWRCCAEHMTEELE